MARWKKTNDFLVRRETGELKPDCDIHINLRETIGICIRVKVGNFGGGTNRAQSLD